jgi:hypothetical protein
MTSWEYDPATFRLVAECLNQLRYRVPPVGSKNFLAQEGFTGIPFVMKLNEKNNLIGSYNAF